MVQSASCSGNRWEAAAVLTQNLSRFDVPSLVGFVSVLANVPGYEIFQIFQTGDLKYGVWSFCGPEERKLCLWRPQEEMWGFTSALAPA